MTTENILSEACECFEYMTECRRYLHRNPGTGFDNEAAMSFIKSELEKMGIAAESCGRCGAVALIGKGKECFLLRADTDALPVREETGLEFSPNNGKMHGCGHDMHGAMLLGAAKILKKHESELAFTVKLMFQSAEETLEGAKDMIESGVLENPKVDFAMMLHVMTGIPFESGTVIVSSPGVSAPAADFFRIEVLGKGCHGSSPSEGIDPIFVSSQIVLSLSEINSRELASGEVASLSIGVFSAGEAANVIPDKAVLAGTMRAMSEEIREYMKKRLCEISRGVAESFRAEAKVDFTSGCPSLYNDEALCGKALSAMTELFGGAGALSSRDMNTGERKTKISGSEDFAYVSQRVPSVMLALAAGECGKGYDYPLHHPKADFDERAMINGCAALVYTVMKK